MVKFFSIQFFFTFLIRTNYFAFHLLVDFTLGKPYNGKLTSYDLLLKLCQLSDWSTIELLVLFNYNNRSNFKPFDVD